MKSAIALSIMMILLSACGRTNSANVLPDVRAYSSKEQDALLAEVLGGACPMSTTLLMHYSIMQEQTVAIGGVK